MYLKNTSEFLIEFEDILKYNLNIQKRNGFLHSQKINEYKRKMPGMCDNPIYLEPTSL